MAETYIQLPTDATGKKARTWSETVGSDTVHSQYVLQNNSKFATYYIGSQLYPASTNNVFSIFNGVGSGKTIKIESLKINISHINAEMLMSCKRTTAQSGGTSVTATKADMTDSDIPAQILIATGATVTATTIFAYINAQPLSQTLYEVIGNNLLYKPFTLAEGHGITVKCDTTNTITYANTICIFTLE